MTDPLRALGLAVLAGALVLGWVVAGAGEGWAMVAAGVILGGLTGGLMWLVLGDV